MDSSPDPELKQDLDGSLVVGWIHSNLSGSSHLCGERVNHYTTELLKQLY